MFSGYVFGDLKTGSLISIGQLCDDDCIALFSIFNIYIIKNNKVIITGKLNNNKSLGHSPSTITAT